MVPWVTLSLLVQMRASKNFMVPWMIQSFSEGIYVHLSNSEGLYEFTAVPWVLCDSKSLFVKFSDSEVS